MKKLLSTMLILTLGVSLTSGCKQEATANLVAKDLNTNLDRLSSVVNKLDTVDNKYLANPDIYSSFTNASSQPKNFAIASSSSVINTDSLKQALIDKITEKLLSQNYSGNENRYRCKKYCDPNGNCYYKDCNGNNYCCGTSGECYECNVIPKSCAYVGETDLMADNITATDNEIIASPIDLNTNGETELRDNDTTTYNNTENNNNETPVIENNNTETNVSENDNVESDDKGSMRIIYFSRDSFSPVKLKYNPRFVSEYNANSINDQIDNYLYKVQKLYAMSEDSIEANNILHNCRQDIFDSISEIKELNQYILDGKCEPTVQQLQALNNYITDIKTTTKRLKNCNGELSRELNNISSADTGVMINSVDVMNSNYLRLINHIDTRITYHKSAIATLEQIKYLLDNAVFNDNITDEEIENLLNNLNNMNKSNQETVSNNDETIYNNDVIDNNVDDIEILDEDITSDVIDEQVDDNIINNNNIDDNTNNEINDENRDAINVDNDTTINDDQVDDDNEINDINDNSIVNNNRERTNLLDTYKESPWKNVDTYRTTNEMENNIDENIVNNTENDVANNTENIDTMNDEYVNDNVNDTSVNNDTTTDNVVNNEVNNGTFNNGVNYNNGSNVNNSGMYHNSVITQNNLDTNNGYGGYYYTNDGEIRNNGMNNDNEIGNNGNTIENNLNRHGNVNTYGYNTMLDIINQGTVNNGINTL